jgi:gluconolactonase
MSDAFAKTVMDARRCGGVREAQYRCRRQMMMFRPPIVEATLFTELPRALHHDGEPNAWVQMTRPGQRLHSFLEGLCVSSDGALWLVDVPYGRIFTVDLYGGWTLALSYDGEPHSLKPWNYGEFALVDYKRGLLRFEPASKRLQTVASAPDGEHFLGLSDLARGPNGDIWFTDSGRTSLSDPTGRLFRYRPNDGLQQILANIPYPNGVALSPDGKFVYVAVTRANAVWRLSADVAPQTIPMVGTYIQLSGGLGPDGLAVDAKGRLAVAHAQAGRAFVFDALGDPLLEIRIPKGTWTTSVAFSRDGTELYIVDAQHGAIWRTKLAID